MRDRRRDHLCRCGPLSFSTAARNSAPGRPECVWPPVGDEVGLMIGSIAAPMKWPGSPRHRCLPALPPILPDSLRVTRWLRAEWFAQCYR